MRVKFALLACVVLALTALLAAPAHAQNKCMSLDGTIVGLLELPGPQGPGWYGWAYLTFGKDPTVHAASLVDLNDGYKTHPWFRPDGSGNFAGNEILTFTIDEGPGGLNGSFQMKGHFLCVGPTQSYCGFSEEGKIVPEAGTGWFAGMRGNISSHGSAAGGDLAHPDNPWYWIAQMTGSICK